MWGKRAPGSGAADDRIERQVGRHSAARGLRFDVNLAPGGYAWWYIDGESDCGTQALSLIAFVGSVFSPYYHAARQRGPTPAMAHCALNIALYQQRGGAWAMTEQKGNVDAAADFLKLGASHIAWQGDTLVMTLHERTAVSGRPIRGVLRLRPESPAGPPVRLHAQRPHWWWPVAPCAQIEVELTHPKVRWCGRAYHDANWGHEPLAAAFTGWSWQRAWHPAGTAVLYDTQTTQGDGVAHAAIYQRSGAVETLPMPRLCHLPASAWGLARRSRGQACEVRALEDTPFYSRSQLTMQLGNRTLKAMHEQLDLTRFTAPWVQFLLPFRMRRQ